MDKKQTAQYLFLYKEIKRTAKELKTRFVKANRDVHLEKLEYAISCYDEKAKIKPLSVSDVEGLTFLRKTAIALKESQSKGWDKKVYKDKTKELEAHKHLAKGLKFNPLDVLKKKR